jgi:hypothetical protein
MTTLHSGAPTLGRTLPPLLDPVSRRVTVSLDDPVGLRVAEHLADQLWKAGRSVESRAVVDLLRDRAAPARQG